MMAKHIKMDRKQTLRRDNKRKWKLTPAVCEINFQVGDKDIYEKNEIRIYVITLSLYVCLVLYRTYNICITNRFQATEMYFLETFRKEKLG